MDYIQYNNGNVNGSIYNMYIDPNTFGLMAERAENVKIISDKILSGFAFNQSFKVVNDKGIVVNLANNDGDTWSGTISRDGKVSDIKETKAAKKILTDVQQYAVDL
jgi:hypothetical protein